MADDVAITQRRVGQRLTFAFGVDRLTYTWRDPSGERQFSVAYEAINVLDPSTLRQNTNRLRVLSFVAVPFAFLVTTGLAHALTEPWTGLCFVTVTLVVFAVICLIVCRFSSPGTKYTMLHMAPMPPGAGGHPIRVIQDKKHDAILEEIKVRWKTRLRSLHAAVNLASAPDKEIAKFNWLKEHAVITASEYAEAVEEVRAHAALGDHTVVERTIN